MTKKKITRFSFTVDNHLDDYGSPTRAQSRYWILEFEDGEILKGYE